MIDLAISVDENRRGATVIETNHGRRLAAPDWPQDSDFRLVAFTPAAKTCEVVPPTELAGDIALALAALEPVVANARKKPDWYGRLTKYAAGALGS